MRTAPTTPETSTRRRRGAAPLWLGGMLSAALLVLGVSGTLSAWTSAIMTNDVNQAGTAAAVVLEETGPDATGAAVTCTTGSSADNTSACSQINKYGDAGVLRTDLQPGDSISTSITMTNTGPGDATTFTLDPGACSSVYNTGPQAGAAVTASDLCDQLLVGVTCTGDATLTVAPVALSSFTGPYSLATGLPSGGSATCTFTVSLPASAPADVAGQTSTQPIDWTLTA